MRPLRMRIDRGILSGGGSMPEIKYVKLNWVGLGRYLTRAAVSGAQASIRMNSIHQPCSFEVHQPMFHDTWANFYNRYKVVGFKYAITFDGLSGTAGTQALATTGTQGFPQMIYAFYSDTVGSYLAAAPTNAQVEAFLETYGRRRSTRYKFIQNSDKVGAHRGRKTLKGYVNLWRTTPLYGESINFGASFGANPTTIQYLTFGICDPNAVGTTDDINVSFKLTFYVKLSEPKIQTQD